MLVFSTRIPLKAEVSKEMSLQLFVEWIKDSPHYNLNDMEYNINSSEDFEVKTENVSFSIRHYSDDKVELSACRLENREPNIVWFNDCIYLNENGNKSLLIQLNCNRVNYNVQLPKIHKPYVVRKFIESGYCSDDAGIPVTDTPILSDMDFFETCANIMRGTFSNMMPVVYISCDYWGNTAVDAVKIAKELSGVAHIFVEKNHDTALRLRDETNSNNVYGLYVGIYFPGTSFCEKFSIDDYNNPIQMKNAIIASVWNALINRLDSSKFNWSQIMVLQSRQKVSEFKDISEKDKQELSEYIANFDDELLDLRQKIDELNHQLQSKQAQLEHMQEVVKNKNADRCFYKTGKEIELYSGEYNDLLYNILSQAQSRYDSNMRIYALIQSLLDANPKIGECSKIIEGVRAVLGNTEKWSNVNKSKLQELGFSINEDGNNHVKLIFRNDPRYMFTVSKTPGDFREGKNLVSDICRIIDIEKRI